MSKRFLILLATSLLMTANSGWQAALCAAPTDPQLLHEQRMKKGIYEEVLINAPPKVVWKSMQQQRTLDPDSTYVKETAVSNLVEQRFSFPAAPFGSAECTLHLADKPGQRVDFSLVSSDDVKAFEGSWVLTPSADGRSTTLALSSYVDPLHVPIPRLITNALVSHKARRNLEMVKKLAEQANLAEKSNPADKSM
jgi:hypothetical protein